MSTAAETAGAGQKPEDRLALPPDLTRQLDRFRVAVRTIKAVEAVGAAIFGVLAAWLVLFLLDRFVDTPRSIRGVAFLAAIVACGLLPRYALTWLWGLRGTRPLARLVARRFPSLGDQLLGAVELVDSRGEQRRSRGLCEAAIGQVAEVAARHDLRAAVPSPRHRLLATLALSALALGGTLALTLPAAAGNAWARLLAPWRSIERYTFARVAPLPDPLVVPHGEPVTLPVALADGSPWRPARASARLGPGTAVSADLADDRYLLPLPALVAGRTLGLAVGDARQRVDVVPTHRPGIVSVSARVRLPDYLGIPEESSRELRGGGLAVVKGSRVAVSATAERALAKATVDDRPIVPDGPTIETPERVVDETVGLSLGWEDTLGLAGTAPVTLNLVARDDEAPSIVVDGLPPRGVILDTETLRFALRTRDDFGVQATGIEWIGDAESPEPTRGEEVLATGGPQSAALDALGTFAPAALGIAPQTVTVRAWVEDRLPGRERVRSAPATFVVMNATDHALWVNDQIARWRQQAAEVRDRELELLARNEELLASPPEDLATPQRRAALREQAVAERTQARRLGRLVEGGAELVRRAMRNPEFDADALDELAEHVATLEEMAARRMPGVGELLEAAAGARPSEPAGDPAGRSEPAGPTASAPRVDSGEPPSPGQAGTPSPVPGPPPPQVSDRESSRADRGTSGTGKGGSASAPGSLGLPVTIVGQSPGGSGGDPQAQQALVGAAVDAQRQLIEDFAAIARQLADVMARLEGTTFVKRLKSASRGEAAVASRLSAVVAGAFGNRSDAVADPRVTQRIEEAGRGNDEVGGKLSSLMDDLDAYAERRPQPTIRSVLEEMKSLDVLGNLRQLTLEIGAETGLSIARSEFWADTLDRWADELVPPPGGGGGGKSGPPRENLPPEIVLEAMRILEAEADLREETRVAEQRRAAVDLNDWQRRTARLADTQDALRVRVSELAATLADLPEPTVRFADEVERMRREILPPAPSQARFGREIELFRAVASVMAEAGGILASPDTGRRAVAAETEAIELLLQSQFGGGGGGGGGGGASPGGGGGGSTRDRALARLGQGINLKARLEAPEEDQAVGRSGRVLPEEFRDGLDAYFNALERGPDPERTKP